MHIKSTVYWRLTYVRPFALWRRCDSFRTNSSLAVKTWSKMTNWLKLICCLIISEEAAALLHTPQPKQTVCESHARCGWKQSCCSRALLTTWSLKPLTQPIVVAWLLAVCFSGSLIRRRKSERAPRTVALLLDQRLRDRIKWFPLLLWELLLPLWKTPAPSQDYYFWQCLPREGTFADLMGPGPLYTAFCMALCHHFHRVERRKKTKKELRDVVSSQFKTRLSRLCDPQHRQYISNAELRLRWKSNGFSLHVGV